MGSDDKHEEIRWSLFGICFLGILVCCGILMCIGFYHVFFEEPPEPEHLPYEIIVYDGAIKLLLIMGLYVRLRTESSISMMLLSWGGKM